MEGLIGALRLFLRQRGHELGRPEYDRLETLCETAGVTASVLRDNLAGARRELEHVAA